MKNLKIALGLAGQLRTLDMPIVLKSLTKFILTPLNPDIYISTWDNRGKSLYNYVQYANNRCEVEFISENYVAELLPNSKYIEIENHKNWYKSISEELQKAHQSLHGNSVANLYKKLSVTKLIENSGIDYDMVIITRPDFIYWDYVDENVFHNVDKNWLWHINVIGTPSYYPNRIYDIFYCGNTNVINQVSNAFNTQTKCWHDKYNTGLTTYDCCKLLYNHVKDFSSVQEIKSVSKVIGDVYRGREGELIEMSNDWGFNVLDLETKIGVR